MHGPKEQWDTEAPARCYALEDYVGNAARWCSGCGDHAVLGALQRLARDEQLPPEKTVVVSGIGCSSRFPHYMKTYGFHGLHGRPLPVACGVRSRRPDLHIFVVTGDGDCCAIGAGHWIHALRYNMNITVLMLDNQIYGLTKMQTSPTTPQGHHSNTHPFGSTFAALNPLALTLGINNVSFVAQSVDFSPAHLYATMQAAYRHPGLSFVRVLQRCPHYMPDVSDALRDNPSGLLLLVHPDGIVLEGSAAKQFENRVEHDPAELDAARRLAGDMTRTPLGLLYRNPEAPRYETFTERGLNMPDADKRAGAQAAVDRYLI